MANKCPKCGSELNLALKVNDTKYDFQCLICGKKYGITNSDTFDYQQRLDKVLEKFEEVDDWNCEYWIGDYYLSKHFESKTFILVHKDAGGIISKLSLDTVEHLIADMKAQK